MTKAKTLQRPVSAQTRWFAALGILFVVGSFTMLVREAFVARRPTAQIEIRVDEILPSRHGYLVSVKVDNTGNATAASLAIEGVLKRGGAVLETSTATLDYVAAGSQRDAALFFSSDPRDGELTVRPKGYIEP
jgi:uncharacterized protein (TIGR02588 family)